MFMTHTQNVMISYVLRSENVPKFTKNVVLKFHYFLLRPLTLVSVWLAGGWTDGL